MLGHLAVASMFLGDTKERKKMKKKDRVLRCKRCGDLIQTNMTGTPESISDRLETRCLDPKAPGGYWYCSYEELVPKKK